MAKTRMKTTPTRLQKDALTAEKIKTGLRHVNSTATKEPLHATSTVVVPAPKRANSISSATSSISHTSDAHSIHSENEFVSTAPLDAAKIITTRSTTPTSILPQSPLQLNSIKLKNNLNSKPTNAAALKNRKIFMITEKCDDMNSETSNANNSSSISGQKRKMYLIMEEEQQQEQQQCPANGITNHSDQEEYIKNEPTGNASKKLTLFTDKCDAQLTHKFEKILPEILSRINSKVKDQATKIATASGTATAVTTAAIKQIGHTVMPSRLGLQVQLPHVKYHSNTVTEKILEPLENDRLPITLPPKKNRMKIINTATIASSSPTIITSISAQRSISAATPVIVANSNLVTVATAPAAPPIITKCSNGNTDSIKKIPQKNINLSTDFLFLMKMLPKLERIPEPHKSHVKSCIEKIVSQNSTLLNE